MREDGKFWMRARGYGGDFDQEHWTGAGTVSPGELDYTFWLWILSHKYGYPATMDDNQFDSIKESWQAAAE